jgi:hypothetical protein
MAEPETQAAGRLSVKTLHNYPREWEYYGRPALSALARGVFW